MKKSLLILAALATACVLQAQEVSSQQEVLSLFAKYNPAVLERAQRDPAYNAILQEVVNNTHLDGSLEAYIEMIALVRNFDTSMQIAALTQEYEDALLMAVTSGSDLQALNQKYRQEFGKAYSSIWAVSVNLQEELIAQYKQILKDLKKNPDLTDQQRKEGKAAINEKLNKSRTYLKQIKNNASEYIGAWVNSSMGRAQNNVNKSIAQLNSVKTKAEMEEAQRARASDNLQVKNKNQKPVAK